jgi:hypothetical protein
MFNQKKQRSLQDAFDKITTDKFKRQYSTVYVTNDYEMFSFKDGNRPIRKTHLKNITDSIATKQIPVPIVVDGNFEICDGQNRFMACKNLKKPVYYIVIDDLTLEDVQRLNANTKTWSPDDFLESYCKQGFNEYIKFRRFKKKYEFGHSECLVILGGWKTKNKGKNINQAFKEGDFRIIDYADACEISDKITKVRKYFDGYNHKCFIHAMLRLFRESGETGYDHSKFLNKLSRQTEKMKKQANTENYLSLIESIYNHGSKIKLRLFTY